LSKNLFEVVNITVSPFCTQPSQRTSFFLNGSALFFSTNIIVQNPGYACSNGKIYPPNAQAYPHYIQTKFCYLEFLSLTNHFCFFLELKKEEKGPIALLAGIFLLDGEDAHAANPYFHTVGYSHSVVQGLTSNFIDNFHRIIQHVFKSVSLQLNAPD